ncbi:AB hydrolase-1 domain-containing protein [Nephila pilipes]|uniref:sn-1-specific diacylglycerol lipase ABHD11 n=1 Tax=Nephila pilipes TaxID=299642 RepID=A0A8X6PGW8_NEPPI|nr:AB hydrolase-1 domain-containing protein [Nephila pilipes]
MLTTFYVCLSYISWHNKSGSFSYNSATLIITPLFLNYLYAVQIFPRLKRFAGILSTEHVWDMIYCLDLRNHGRSEYTKDFSLKCLVADLENFMKNQNIPKAVLISHSLGSKIALEFALSKPEMVEKLVIEDMFLFESEKSKEYIRLATEMLQKAEKMVSNLPSSVTEKQLFKMMQPYFSKYFPMMLKTSNTSKKLIPIPVYKDKSGKFVWDLNVEVISSFEKNLLREFQIDISNDPVYHGKSLFLSADHSVYNADGNKDLVLKHFPNAQFYVFKGGFHTYHNEFPDLFVKVVSDLIVDTA